MKKIEDIIQYRVVMYSKDGNNYQFFSSHYSTYADAAMDARYLEQFEMGDIVIIRQTITNEPVTGEDCHG